MRVHFYAPLKPPDHAVPSGDRRMAKLLIQALALAGHEVELASRLVTREPTGKEEAQARLRELAEAETRRILTALSRSPDRPDIWLTYHLYYKAPDLIGPAIARKLSLPYVVVEASLAPKRAHGPWARGHAAVLDALRLARRIVALNPADVPCLPEPGKVTSLDPFLDAAPYVRARGRREATRAALAERLDLDPAAPWLITAAMMRPGDKLRSYACLAEALARLTDRRWTLLVAGDGEARPEVSRHFARFGRDRVRFLGALAEPDLAEHAAAADLFVWPALNEAYGMALLEAQASGLPVVAGQSGGVASIVEHEATGLLSTPGDAEALAGCVRRLLDSPGERAAFAGNAVGKVRDRHGIDTAAVRLDAIIGEVG